MKKGRERERGRRSRGDSWTERKEKTTGKKKRWIQDDRLRKEETVRQRHMQREDERQEREWETENRKQTQRERGRQRRGGGSGREHITCGRLCHGVNGVLPLPIIPVPFEPWPLHTERWLTPSSASSRGLAPLLLLLLLTSAGRLVSKSACLPPAPPSWDPTCAAKIPRQETFPLTGML